MKLFFFTLSACSAFFVCGCSADRGFERAWLQNFRSEYRNGTLYLSGRCAHPEYGIGKLETKLRGDGSLDITARAEPKTALNEELDFPFVPPEGEAGIVRFAGNVVWAEKDALRQNFFASGDAPAECRRYGSLPHGAAERGASDRKNIALVFNFWLTFIMKAEYLPDPGFVRRNLRLFAAKDNKGLDRDLAFLSFETGGQSFLMTQTGGADGRIWMFTEVPPRSDGLGAFRLFTKRYVNGNFANLLPAAAVSCRGKFCRGRPKYGKPAGKYDIEFFSGEGEFCLVIRKTSYGKMPPRFPPPDQWFAEAERANRKKTSDAILIDAARGASAPDVNVPAVHPPFPRGVPSSGSALSGSARD